MSLVLIVWLVTTLIPSIGALSALTTIVGMVVFVLVFMYAMIESDSGPLKKFLSYKKMITLTLVVLCVTPGKESMWYMVGAYGTQKLIENPEAQNLASDGVDVLKALMAKAKKELADDTSKK